MHSDPALKQAHDQGLFKRRRKPLSVRWRAVRVWLAGASLRRTAAVLRDEAEFSHEAVRLWAARFAHLFHPRKRDHARIVVDETTIILANRREVYEWAALDPDTRDVILVWKTQGRGGLEALLFMKAVLRRCRGKPFVMVDKGSWYPWALDALKLEWKVQRGAPGASSSVTSAASNTASTGCAADPNPGTPKPVYQACSTCTPTSGTGNT